MKHKHHDLMVAYANDTSIEIECKNNIGIYWNVVKYPVFSEDVEYRIKPKPKYRPYNFDEAKKELKGVYIKCKDSVSICVISVILEQGIRLSDTSIVDYNILLKWYEKEDGTPLGILE